LSDDLVEKIKNSEVCDGDNKHDAFTEIIQTCTVDLQGRIKREIHRDFKNVYRKFLEDDIERGIFCQINE
jgi:hypothetical protein